MPVTQKNFHESLYEIEKRCLWSSLNVGMSSWQLYPKATPILYQWVADQSACP